MWVLIDWGTSRFRLWSVSNGRANLEHSSDNGVGQLQPKARQIAFLIETIEKLDELPDFIFAFGMVGSSLGPFQTRFLETPASITEVLRQSQSFELSMKEGQSLPIFVTPGLKTSDNPPDVMRGEELQALLVDLSDGVVLCPGTHSKHITLEANQIVGFSTFMTGELFQATRKLPSLSPFFGAASKNLEPEWFNRGVELADGTFSQALFAIRRWGLSMENFEGADELLSGLLIGSELNQLTMTSSNARVVLIAEDMLAERYQSVLRKRGISFDSVSNERAIERIADRIEGWMSNHA